MSTDRPDAHPHDLQADGAVTAALAELPLVSVLIRSMGRPSLQEALESVARQTYGAIEVVVINARGTPHPPLPLHCGRFSLRLIEPGVPLARAAAANRALDEAHGQWLIFLDDDDLLDAEHVARLRSALAAQPDVAVVYAGVRLLARDGTVQGTLDEPFEQGRLWLANFLPIHAVLFSRRLVEAGCRFDEALPVYEDWDFWHQLARKQDFLHVAGVSASYRMLGDSGLGARHDEDLSHAWRQVFYRKWLSRLSAPELEQVAAAAEHARGDLRQALLELEQMRSQALALQTEIAARGAALEQMRQALTSANQALAEEQVRRSALQVCIDTLQQRHDALLAAEQDAQARLANAEADLRAALSEYGRLEQGYRQVTASLSWRITAPLRAVLAALTGPGRRALVRRLLRALPVSASAKQRCKVWLSSRPWGLRLLRGLMPQGTPAAVVDVAPPAFDKEAVRTEAEHELTRFLAGGERITLGEAGGRPQVSVVVVLYNQAGLSLLCLRALAASRGVGFETLIVDNASSDRMPALLQRIDGATLLPQHENLGFVRAVNLAAAQARGEHLVLLNNDALVEPDTLARAAARLHADAGAGAVGGPILLWDGRLQEAGSIIWRDGSCLGYGRGDSPDAAEYRFVRDVDYCSGAFLMVRRALFESLGRFDPAYAPAYYEESDFCARLWEAGQRIVYDPAVRIRHFEFASAQPGQAIELQQRHRALFVQRHQDFLARQQLPDVAAVWRARQRLRAGARRVLIIDDRVPLPWLGQGYPRAASMVAAITAGGDFVTHYPLQFPNESAADVARALPETVEVMLGQGLPALAGFLATRQGLYDVVIVSRPHNMEALRQVLRGQPQLLGAARLVYDAEALFSLRDIARAAVQGDGLSAAEQQRRIDEEMALARGADCIVAVSAQEAEHYRKAGYADVQVLGHTMKVRPSTVPFEARDGFLFIGAVTDDDTPNADSLRWFVHEVWPLVQRQLGSAAQLRVVGSCEAPSVLALAGPTVHIAGPAAELGPSLDAARVFVVPTRYAAGVPHKAHEAAARGLPIVATPLIAQQLGWSELMPNAVDAAGFAAECLRLHADAAHWGKVRQRLLAAVQSDCAPATFERALQAILGRGGRPSTELERAVQTTAP